MHRLGVAMAAVVLMFALAAVPAAAADTRVVGAYQIAAAFAHTPVYPQEANPLVIRVATLAGEPVGGLEHTLRLRVGVPNQVTETWGLVPLHDQPGAYQVILSLPRAGTYFMDLFGTIDGQAVNERFITGQQGLDKVIAHGPSFPRGAGIVLLITFGGYLVGLAWLVGRAALRRQRGRQPTPSER
jgi:hypothetical protein